MVVCFVGGSNLDTTTEYVHETPISLTRSDIYDDEKAVLLTHRYGERSYFCGKYINITFSYKKPGRTVPNAVMVLGRFFISTSQAFNLVIFVIGCRIQTHINTLIRQ